MNQREGLVAKAAVDGEIADVGGDDCGAGPALGEDEEGGAAGVHEGVFFKQGGDATSLRPRGNGNETPVRNGRDDALKRKPVGFHQVAGFGQGHLGGADGLVDHRHHADCPSMPLVLRVDRRDERPRIHQISNFRSLHASRDPGGRFS